MTALPPPTPSLPLLRVRLAAAMRLHIAVALKLVTRRRWRLFNQTKIVGPTALAAQPTLNVLEARPQQPVGCSSTLTREDEQFRPGPNRKPVLRIRDIAILVKDGAGGPAGWTQSPGVARDIPPDNLMAS